MEIIEAARQLGKAIQSNDRYVQFQAARAANDADPALQKLIGEFNLLRMQINEETSKEDKDEEKIKSLNERLRKVYADVMINDNMAAYNQAKNDLDAVIQKMNAVIDLCIEGEDPDTCEPASGCTGSCSTCGGCH